MDLCATFEHKYSEFNLSCHAFDFPLKIQNNAASEQVSTGRITIYSIQISTLRDANDVGSEWRSAMLFAVLIYLWVVMECYRRASNIHIREFIVNKFIFPNAEFILSGSRLFKASMWWTEWREIRPLKWSPMRASQESLVWTQQCTHVNVSSLKCIYSADLHIPTLWSVGDSQFKDNFLKEDFGRAIYHWVRR